MIARQEGAAWPARDGAGMSLRDESPNQIAGLLFAAAPARLFVNMKDFHSGVL
jgi:hypothetical protein